MASVRKRRNIGKIGCSVMHQEKVDAPTQIVLEGKVFVNQKTLGSGFALSKWVVNILRGIEFVYTIIRHAIYKLDGNMYSMISLLIII